MKVQTTPGDVGEGFRHEARDQSSLASQRLQRVFDDDEIVGCFHWRRVPNVNLDLTWTIFRRDLLDYDAHCFERLGQTVQELCVCTQSIEREHLCEVCWFESSFKAHSNEVSFGLTCSRNSDARLRVSPVSTRKHCTRTIGPSLTGFTAHPRHCPSGVRYVWDQRTRTWIWNREKVCGVGGERGSFDHMIKHIEVEIC